MCEFTFYFRIFNYVKRPQTYLFLFSQRAVSYGSIDGCGRRQVAEYLITFLIFKLGGLFKWAAPISTYGLLTNVC